MALAEASKSVWRKELAPRQASEPRLHLGPTVAFEPMETRSATTAYPLMRAPGEMAEKLPTAALWPRKTWALNRQWRPMAVCGPITQPAAMVVPSPMVENLAVTTEG